MATKSKPRREKKKPKKKMKLGVMAAGRSPYNSAFHNS